MNKLTIYKGLSLRNKHIIVVNDDGALPLAGHEHQFQILDRGMNYIGQATTTTDSVTAGKVNISMTAEETAAINGTAHSYVLLVKHTADGWVVPSALGPVDIVDGPAWQS